MATNQPAQKPPPAPQTRDQPGKRAAILIIGVLVVVGMTYGAGLRSATRRLKQANEEMRRVTARADAFQADVALRDATIRQLEARRQLHLALLALDQRNFGTAQSHLHAAGALLEGAANGDGAALAEPLKAMNLVAVSDFSGQRERVLDFARRLDAVVADRVPAANAAPASPAPASPAPAPAAAP